MKQLLYLFYLCLGNAQAITLKDPTRPSPNSSMIKTSQGPTAITRTTLKLSAIIKNNQNKQAIINGRSFSQGQEVQGYKLILISQNHVILKNLDGSDGRKTLFVNNNNIKKDVNNDF